MTVRIGFWTAVVCVGIVAGTVERVVHTVVNRPKGKSKNEQKFWKEFAFQVEQNKQNWNLNDEDGRERFRNQIRKALIGIHTATIAELDGENEVARFEAEYAAKLAAL